MDIISDTVLVTECSKRTQAALRDPKTFQMLKQYQASGKYQCSNRQNKVERAKPVLSIQLLLLKTVTYHQLKILWGNQRNHQEFL